MKLTLVNIKKEKTNTQNKLYKKACSYVIDRWPSYDNKKNIFTDVLNYGCISGVVGFLIYYKDTVKFYNRYKTEIDKLLYDTMRELGIYSLKEIFGNKWDEEDPLCLDVYNSNLLAWFGFEETLRQLAFKFDDLKNTI